MKLLGSLILVSLLTLSERRRIRSKRHPTTKGTIRVVSIVNVPFTVADHRGKLITTLKQENFKVFEDEKPQTITNFSSESNLPLVIGLLIGERQYSR